MPQSLAALHVHVVFSTKNREPRLDFAWAPRLYDYIGGIVAHRRGVLVCAGGMPDHVHLLVSLGREWSLADLLRDLKAGSSKWIHDTFADQRSFAWQSGYGAFAVSTTLLDVVKHYIANQANHHRDVTFQDELRTLLRQHDLSWDERYVWD